MRLKKSFLRSTPWFLWLFHCSEDQIDEMKCVYTSSIFPCTGIKSSFTIFQDVYQHEKIMIWSSYNVQYAFHIGLYKTCSLMAHLPSLIIS